MMRSIIISGFLILMFLVLAGCFPRPQSGRIAGSPEYVKGEVVKGFPKLPLYPEAKVIESFGFKGEYGVSFITDEKISKVLEFYNEGLPKLGWQVEVRRQSETNYLFEVKNAENQGEVFVNTTADGKKTAITIAVKPR